MRGFKFHISVGAAVLLAALYLLWDWQLLAALLIPVLVHEAGHIAALLLMRARIRGLRVDLTGLSISYAGRLSYFSQLSAALAGPLAGLALAAGAAYFAATLDSGFLRTTAGVSLILSAFNLLPALPLDGGRALSALLLAAADYDKACAIVYRIGTATGIVLLLAGLFLVWQGRGLALEIAAVWLLLCQTGIVKKGGVL